MPVVALDPNTGTESRRDADRSDSFAASLFVVAAVQQQNSKKMKVA